MIAPSPDPKTWQLRRQRLDLDRPIVMGILNVTPDSFSDGGSFEKPEKAVARAWQMIEEGAHIIDIGGESTRPGAVTVSPEEEWKRIMPVLTHMVGKADLPVSVDTRHAEVARRALDEGADIINDVSGGRDPQMFSLAAEAGCGFVLVHSRGEPAGMQREARYENVVADVCRELEQSLKRARSEGLDLAALCVDPGFGFAKNAEQNHRLLGGLQAVRELGYPLLVGLSRKSMLRAIVGGGREELSAASHAAALAAYKCGAQIFRVHDVKGSLAALKTFSLLSGEPLRRSHS